jgi:protein phosphatase
VGGGAGAKCEPEFAEFSLYEDDWLLLCTDGLTDMLSLDELESILNAPGDMPLKAKALVDAANRAGGVDNITVVLVHRR